ncbi:hypothetical protein GTP06_11470 [Lactococcus lactis]|uniref:hypothetical protein n=1 Tax=Lactococcus lactis TaxID=1358 RepID=UPI0013C76A84|nr:hypothetical protein [Lactococcus lactis]NEX58930.1 hypothetical protein [Lactococcus lactis]
MKSTFYANIELGGEITQVSFQATSSSDVIEQIWRTYGISTPIIEIWAEVTDEDSSKQ